MSTTKVTWKIKGQRTEQDSYVPDGEFYDDWISETCGVDPAKIVIVSTGGSRGGIKVGDRVRMDTSQPGWLGAKVPDMGVGTVTATEGEFLMNGMYVAVEWDEGYGGEANFPSLQSLVRVED